MTLNELVTAVAHDMAIVSPKSHWTVDMHARKATGLSKPTVIEFEIYHDEHVPGVDDSAFYEGDTPAEAYRLFKAAVFKSLRVKPSLDEQLALIAGDNGAAS